MLAAWLIANPVRAAGIALVLALSIALAVQSYRVNALKAENAQAELRIEQADAATRAAVAENARNVAECARVNEEGQRALRNAQQARTQAEHRAAQFAQRFARAPTDCQATLDSLDAACPTLRDY
jgi:hypothetical protein